MGAVLLILVVIGFSAMSLLMKLGGKRGLPSLSLSALMFACAGVLVLLIALATGQATGIPSITLRLGLLGGLASSVAFLLYIKALKVGPYGFTVAVGSASGAIPVIFSAIYWGQRLSLLHIMGIAMTLCGVLLIFGISGNQIKEPTNPNWGKWAALITSALIVNAGMLIACEAVTRSGQGTHLQFLLTVYVTATAIALTPTLAGSRISLKALPYAGLAAIGSIVGNFCMLRSLEYVPGALVFPTALCMPVVTAVILSRVLFGERLTQTGFAGIALAILGIGALSIK